MTKWPYWFPVDYSVAFPLLPTHFAQNLHLLNPHHSHSLPPASLSRWGYCFRENWTYLLLLLLCLESKSWPPGCSAPSSHLMAHCNDPQVASGLVPFSWSACFHFLLPAEFHISCLLSLNVAKLRQHIPLSLFISTHLSHQVLLAIYLPLGRSGWGEGLQAPAVSLKETIWPLKEALTSRPRFLILLTPASLPELPPCSIS